MSLERGFIRRFDPEAWRADVEIVGAPGALLPGVPVAAHLGADLLLPGTAVWLCLAEGGRPADGLVLATHGRASPPRGAARQEPPAATDTDRAGHAP